MPRSDDATRDDGREAWEASGPGPKAFEWWVDPTEYALAVANSRRTGDETVRPAPCCTEAGRRLLLMQFRFSSWVLRRVEKVEFEHDRRVVRRTTIELRVPEEAPEVVLSNDEGYWLVPLSVMRRRTLVNLDISDEEGTSIPMLGLRFTQALDESMLRAAASIALGTPDLSEELSDLIGAVVSGTREEVEKAQAQVALALGHQVDAKLLESIVPLREASTRVVLENHVFGAAIERLWHNFTLYALLPLSLGRQRLIRLCVDEPTDWKTQAPKLVESNGVVSYRPFASTARPPVRSMLGIEPVRLRFLTPSAENCTSYHFEFTAPPDVRIERATLLAGRPQTATAGIALGHKSVDDVTPRGPTAGLHAVEVPNGSLCRAQIDLRVPSQGWLGTLLVAAVACLSVVISVVVHALLHGGDTDHWSPEQVTNIVLLLVTVSAGSASYVAHRHAHAAAATMVRGLRFVGAFMMAVPAILAGWLVYLGESAAADPWRLSWLVVVWVALSCAATCLVVVLLAWSKSLSSQKRDELTSPWDLTGVTASTLDDASEEDRTYLEAHHALGFDRPAVGFHTAEGWHERYGWDDAKQAAAVHLLRPPIRCSCDTAAHRSQDGDDS